MVDHPRLQGDLTIRWKPDYVVLERPATKQKRYLPRIRYRRRLFHKVFKAASDCVEYRDEVCRRAKAIFGAEEEANGPSRD